MSKLEMLVGFLDLDPSMEYPENTFKNANNFSRVIVRGSENTTRKECENFITKLYEHKVKPEKVWLFTLNEDHFTPKSENLLFPACIPASSNPDNYGFRQYRNLPTILKKFKNIELVWYHSLDGKGIKDSECKLLNKKEISNLLKKWVYPDYSIISKYPIVKFDWYFIDGTGKISIQYGKELNSICKQRGERLIISSRLSLQEAKQWLKNSVNFLSFKGTGEEINFYEMMGIAKRLYPSNTIYLSQLAINRLRLFL